MKPRKAIPRSTKPIKRSRVRATGKPSRRFKESRDPEYAAWIRTQPCVIGAAEWGVHAGSVECCHVKSRGAAGVDRGNTVPMCSLHHTIQHTIGILTFQQRFEVDLRAIAERLGREYEAFA